MTKKKGGKSFNWTNVVHLAPSAFNGITCPPLNMRFPKLYRTRGFGLNIHNGIVFGDPQKPITRYSLNTEPDLQRIGGGASLRHEAVLKLDPALDSGWFIIRHHSSERLRSSYLNAVWDLTDHTFDNEIDSVEQTEVGLFTLLRRPPPTDDRPKNLIVYVATVPATGPAAEYTAFLDWFHVVDDTGAVLSEDVMIPSHVKDEDFAAFDE